MFFNLQKVSGLWGTGPQVRPKTVKCGFGSYQQTSAREFCRAREVKEEQKNRKLVVRGTSRRHAVFIHSQIGPHAVSGPEFRPSTRDAV